MKGYEPDLWSKIQAKWYTRITEPRHVRVVVIHDMEFAETDKAAEVIARDFATRGPENKGSAHICVDNDSVVRCVDDNDVAFAAPGCNGDGIQIELAGFARQTRDQWLDDYGQALLSLGADAAAQFCLKYDVPVKHLTNEELASGAHGIIGHYQASAVYKKSDHQDPGPGFPWDYFIDLVQMAYDARLTSFKAGL